MDESRKPTDAAPKAHDRPAGLIGKTVTAIPVALTVLATMLAGLSSGEMTQAQYHRSLAAQQQSKAGDQWNFFQAKRIRGSSLELAAEQLPPCDGLDAQKLRQQVGRMHDLLQRLGSVAQSGQHPELRATIADMEALRVKLSAGLESTEGLEALTVLAEGRLPGGQAGPDVPAAVKEALNALRARAAEADLRTLVAGVSDAELAEAVAAALARAAAFDKQSRPVNRVMDELSTQAVKMEAKARTIRRLLRNENDMIAYTDAAVLFTELNRTAETAAESAEELTKELRSARYTVRARCYEREARDNEAVAGLYEIQVRKSDQASDRCRGRSTHFFYGMLLAQAGVTVASLSLAVRSRSLLWTLSGTAGLAALGLSGYVYFFL